MAPGGNIAATASKHAAPTLWTLCDFLIDAADEGEIDRRVPGDGMKIPIFRFDDSININCIKSDTQRLEESDNITSG